MRRPAYDSNVAFEGKIKSMRLISEMIGFGPMPAPDREVEQRLTLNSRGKIWFSNYLYGDGVKQKLHRKECSTVAAEPRCRKIDGVVCRRAPRNLSQNE